MEVFESLKANLVGKNARIVLPEGEEPRILQATKRLVILKKLKFILKLKESWMVMRSSTLNIILNLKKWFLPWWSVARAK